MKRLLIAVVTAAAVFVSTGMGIAMADNPHCLGNSDNARVDHGVHQNLGGCH